jgi:hypothetical protein
MPAAAAKMTAQGVTLALLVYARERPESGDGLFDPFAAPPPVREPQRVVRMMRTRGPRGVDKRVMEVLLDFINDVADILHRSVGIQPTPRGRFDDRFIMSRADGGLHVRAKQRNDASLIFGGYSARRLLLALYRTRLTCRHALLRDQMIAAEEPAAQGTQAPANRGGFAATCRTLEFEWNGEHLSAC